MPTTRRSPTTEQVLDAAEALVAAEGASALTMRSLSQRLGVSYQVVYSRLGDKSGVFRALHARGWERLAQQTASLAGPQPVDAELIVRMGRGYLEFAVAHPVLFAVMTGSPVPEFTRDDDARRVEWNAFRRCWGAACHAWRHGRAYEPDGDPPRLSAEDIEVAWRVWAAVHGITVVHLAGHPSPSRGLHPVLADQVLAVLGER